MGDRVRDEVYNTLSNASYQPTMEKRLKIPLKDGEQVWKVIAKDKYIQHDDYTGFDATIYKKESKTKHGQDELIIAYRGTEPNRWYGNGANDIYTDIVNIAGKKKIDHFDVSFYAYDGKLDIDLKPKNQFTLAERLAKDLKKDHPKAHITLTGHSLGAGLAGFVAAKHGFEAVTFNAPDVTHLLPDDLQAEVKAGKFDDKIINYVNPKDSIGSGAVVEYDGHIGSTYYIGPAYEIQNKDQNPFYRAWQSIAGEKNHNLFHFKFDRYGNLNNPIMVNAATGESIWQSPRYYSSEAATIDVTPEHLKNTARDLKQFSHEVEAECQKIRGLVYTLDAIQTQEHVLNQVVHSSSDFSFWFNEKTNSLCKTLETKALAFAEADAQT
ncbi:lipase family protein [Fictibacillus terranigra]|uniref:Fungal lipase-like domain-containing protein n=1 Tax=Fictibacillus terranigra TaxID=3058424 RepID=A0ABT8E1K8_9BACL|nr:hypothetical protein [Fictibacillus sp. CENA-BCM004]MDN4071789.1 hypothetical protein [Fictibacillus sp. CENA-BCM004]